MSEYIALKGHMKPNGAIKIIKSFSKHTSRFKPKGKYMYIYILWNEGTNIAIHKCVETMSLKKIKKIFNKNEDFFQQIILLKHH